MDLSLPRTGDNNAYVHKKFGQAKRSREVDTVPNWQQVNFAPNLIVSPAHYLPYNFMVSAERSGTPSSVDYAIFATQFNATSTPSIKRQCLNSDGPYAKTNSSADSGIELTSNSSSTAVATSASAAISATPAVAAAATAASTANGTAKGGPLHYQLKRKLPSASKLTQPSSEQPYIAELPVGSGGGISAEKVYHTPVKRMKCSYQSRRAIGSSKATSHLPALTNDNSTTKNNNAAMTGGAVFEINASVIKSVLKPTPVGTLELPAATTSNTASSANPTATAAILTSISEDKLRSICTYHTNMVRKFPKKERTPKDQERRNKNTIACRMSRRFKKVEQIAAEQQCKQFELQQMRMHEEILRATALLEQLEGLNGQVENHDDETEIDVVNIDGETSVVNTVGNMLGKMHTGSPTGYQAFTIENILGNGRMSK